MKLDGKCVLITGGAEGIGAACGHELRARGARLSIVDLKAPSPALIEDGLYTCGDIADHAVRRLAFERTLDRFGTVDVLINNVGVGLYASAKTARVDLSRRMFDVNVFAPLAMAQLVAPVLTAKRSGVIVNIGSIGGEVALPWSAMYCASKHALHSVSQSLRRELKPFGIRVITVMPGVVNTGFRSHVLQGQPPSNVAAMVGMPPVELAQAIRKKVEGRGSVLIVPWYGRMFALVDRIAPWATDLYIESCWSSAAHESGRTLHTSPNGYGD